jgi:hypothetical protein
MAIEHRGARYGELAAWTGADLPFALTDVAGGARQEVGDG